jgi:hypothetical protein
VGETVTTRQKFEQHASDPSCQGCHQLVDSIGFGLEMMDAIGRFREIENGQVVDSSGALVGTDVDGAFTGPAELALKLSQSRQASDCFVRQLFRFVEGRTERDADQCELAALQERFAGGEQTIAGLVVSMVARPTALDRRMDP